MTFSHKSNALDTTANDLVSALLNIRAGIEAPAPVPEDGPRTWIVNLWHDKNPDKDILMSFDPDEQGTPLYSAEYVNMGGNKSCIGYGITEAQAQEDLEERMNEWWA